ncbi:hypothetical protein [Streptomyces sp. NPDC001222]|uniref:hypothetical protein n=1 Tax=Streptomyces sp. NPDC001222 TaxID=3364548 RepID=UPI0036B11A7F
MGDYSRVHRADDVDLDELAHLYRIAPLGNKSPEALATVFGNSMFACFVYSDGALVGAGRPLATAWTAPASVMWRWSVLRRCATPNRE